MGPARNNSYFPGLGLCLVNVLYRGVSRQRPKKAGLVCLVGPGPLADTQNEMSVGRYPNLVEEIAKCKEMPYATEKQNGELDAEGVVLARAARFGFGPVG